MKRARHPMQPLVIASGGIVRFKANEIVRHLVDRWPGAMNELARMGFQREDREQLAQLIGYSLSGFGDLSYAPCASVLKADRLASRLLRAKRRRR